MRLRRTIVTTVALALVVVGTVHAATRDDPSVRAVGALKPPATTSAAPTVAPGANAEDGSATPETSTPGATTVPQNGDGEITVVPVSVAKTSATGRVVHYTVEIEGGLDVDATTVASSIQTILLDPKGWQKVDGIHFVNVSPQQAAKGAKVDIRVTLASPGLTDELCAPMKTLSQVSCWNGERSVLNFRRWALGDDSYGEDVESYRIYQVNHEVGHGLGHQHRTCPGKGRRAPVMVQQTLDLGGCKAWPWPSGA